MTNGSTNTDNRYTYDNSGRLTQIYLAHFGLYRNQSYDERGRITSSYLNTTSGGGSFISYRYEYDNYGNRTVKKYYYGDGILHNYTWTRGRLLERIATGSNATIGQYTYDLNGVRYTKTAGGVTTTYFYDGNTLTGENRSDGKRLRYFYDTTGLCGFSYYNGSTTKYYTYVKDVLGNIVMIKDDMGVPLVRYTYNEWGVCTMTTLNLDGGEANALETELGNVNPFRYRGYYYDTESGLYYLMSRYYDPEIGQFISRDTVDYMEPDKIGGLDLYAYCGNNPIMYVDPMGHIALWLGVLIAIGIAGLMGGGIKAGISAHQGSSIGQIILDGVMGFFMGMTIAGGVILLIGVGIVLVKGLILGTAVIGSVGATLAAIGAAAMFLGGFVIAVLNGEDPPNSSAFPEPGSVPSWPPPITGS